MARCIVQRGLGDNNKDGEDVLRMAHCIVRGSNSIGKAVKVLKALDIVFGTQNGGRPYGGGL